MPKIPYSLIKLLLRWRRYRGRHKPISEQRRDMEKTAALFAMPADIECREVDVAGIPGEWICPHHSDPEPVILYLHGGGYSLGSVATHRPLIARIALACQARALAIDYRLAPEYPFPHAIDDARNAYSWLIEQGISPRKIIIMGDSAGGGLSIATLLSLKDANAEMPAAAVCISPWTDMEASGASFSEKAKADPMIDRQGVVEFAAMYLNGADPRSPLASPLYADLRGLPPLLLQVGSCEVLLDDSTRIAERARNAGVEVELQVWDNMIHVWHYLVRSLPQAQQAIAKIAAFVHRII